MMLLLSSSRLNASVIIRSYEQMRDVQTRERAAGLLTSGANGHSSNALQITAHSSIVKSRIFFFASIRSPSGRLGSVILLSRSSAPGARLLEASTSCNAVGDQKDGAHPMQFSREVAFFTKSRRTT
jgi:hypothetical protein